MGFWTKHNQTQPNSTKRKNHWNFHAPKNKKINYAHAVRFRSSYLVYTLIIIHIITSCMPETWFFVFFRQGLPKCTRGEVYVLKCGSKHRGVLSSLKSAGVKLKIWDLKPVSPLRVLGSNSYSTRLPYSIVLTIARVSAPSDYSTVFFMTFVVAETTKFIKIIEL